MNPYPRKPTPTWGQPPQPPEVDPRLCTTPPNDYVYDDSDMDSVPPGYVRAYRQSAEPGRSGRRSRLLLPVSLMEQMEWEQKQATLALENDTQVQRAQEGQGVHSAQADQGKSDPEKPAAPGEPASETADQPPPPAQLPPLPQLSGDSRNRRSKAVRVIEQAEFDRVSQQPVKLADRQREARAQELQKRLSSHGAWRHHLYPLCQHRAEGALAGGGGVAGEGGVKGHGVGAKPAQRAHIRACFALLDKAHPHFAEVTDLYRSNAMAAVGEDGPTGVMAPPPVLLLGVPGLGKTHYAKALAKVLGLPFVSLAFDTGLTNSALLGNDRHWSNTHHGALFEHLCLDTVANPMVLLDEIDKVTPDKVYQQSPLAALHSCLEPVSSQHVKDISVEITFDASRVVWVATGNDARLIPSTLLSRFTVFHVLPPVGEDAYWLTQSLCESVLANDGRGMPMPSSAIRLALAVFSPRQQYRSLEMACRRAQADERTEFLVEDFPEEIQEEVWASLDPAQLAQHKAIALQTRNKHRSH